MDHVAAVVLTYRRPRLATSTVRDLIERQGFRPDQVLVVVNGEGGLEDAPDMREVRILRLGHNLGPAGGFDRGLRLAFSEPAIEWAYLCEDDASLLDIPSHRVERVLDAVDDHERRRGSTRVGAVVAFGRCFYRGGATLPYPPAPGPALQPVDVSAWGATLVRREVVDRGVYPDEAMFFGYEDFDFFLRITKAGLGVMVDAESGRAVAHQMTLSGRDEILSGHRPDDAAEPWRAYYAARNFFALARRYGDWRWLAWHLVFSIRRVQLARSWPERAATAVGLVDGLRGRLGFNPRYRRTLGEWAGSPPRGPEFAAPKDPRCPALNIPDGRS